METTQKAGQKAGNQQPASIANFLNTPSTAKFLADTICEKKGEFVSNLIALCDGDKNLAACDYGHLMKCALNATALNLPLNKNLGYAYVIAYNETKKERITETDGNGKELTKWVEKKVAIPHFQIGYKGLIQLAIRTGQYKLLNACEVREGEINRNKFTGEIKFLGEKPNGKIVGYLAYFEMTNGFSASLYMSEEQIESHAMRFSKMYQNDKKYSGANSKWSDPDARPKMAMKTVLKGLLGTYGLMTTEFAKAFEHDNEAETETANGNRYQEAEVIEQNEPAEPEKTDVKPKTFKM
jgi:recombination protein RecT